MPSLSPLAEDESGLGSPPGTDCRDPRPAEALFTVTVVLPASFRTQQGARPKSAPSRGFGTPQRGLCAVQTGPASMIGAVICSGVA